MIQKKPSNPMINAGAIVTTSLIKGSSLEEKKKKECYSSLDV